MTLPIEISPSPLVTSAIEIRFVSELEKQKLFPLVYKKFQNELPNLNENTIPKELRVLDPQLKNSPDYILSNNNFSLSFGINVISFENVSDYKLWNNYFPFVVDCLNKFFELGIIKYIERIGVRYASIFDHTENIAEVINQIPTIPINDFEQKFAYYRCDLVKDDFNLHLQLANNAKIIKNEKPLSGSYIDIDASFTSKIDANKNIYSIIDKLHTHEKEVFFGLVKKSFLDTLDVKY